MYSISNKKFMKIDLGEQNCTDVWTKENVWENINSLVLFVLLMCTHEKENKPVKCSEFNELPNF